MSGGDTEKEKVKMVSGGDVWDICPQRSMSGWDPEKEKVWLVSESGDWDILSMRVMEAELGKPYTGVQIQNFCPLLSFLGDNSSCITFLHSHFPSSKGRLTQPTHSRNILTFCALDLCAVYPGHSGE